MIFRWKIASWGRNSSRNWNKFFLVINIKISQDIIKKIFINLIKICIMINKKLYEI